MIEVNIAQRVGDFELEVAFQADAPIVGLFGRSGSGKTSLVNAIAGVSRPRRGRIAVNGDRLFDSERRIDLPPERRRLGYVFQDGLLFPHLDVEANLLYGLRRAPGGPRIIEPAHIIDLLGMRGLLHRLPQSLSGGEKQRVAIGRALLAQPRLLLMDEPLASLDIARRDEVMRYIELLRDELGIPIVYVSHSVAEITRLADTVVLLSEGRSIAVGDVDDVMGRLDLRPQTGRYEAGSVLDTVVVAHDLADELTTLRFEGGELTVPNVEALVGERVRVRIRARDVSLAIGRPTGMSILNVLQGTLISIADDGGPIVEAQLRIGQVALRARITRRSRADLALAEGQLVYALVKAVSIDRRSVGYA